MKTQLPHVNTRGHNDRPGQYIKEMSIRVRASLEEPGKAWNFENQFPGLEKPGISNVGIETYL